MMELTVEAAADYEIFRSWLFWIGAPMGVFGLLIDLINIIWMTRNYRGEKAPSPTMILPILFYLPIMIWLGNGNGWFVALGVFAALVFHFCCTLLVPLVAPDRFSAEMRSPPQDRD